MSNFLLNVGFVIMFTGLIATLLVAMDLIIKGVIQWIKKIGR